MRKDGTRNSSSQGLVWHLQTLPCSTAAFRWASTSCLLPGGAHMWGPTFMCLDLVGMSPTELWGAAGAPKKVLEHPNLQENMEV